MEGGGRETISVYDMRVEKSYEEQVVDEGESYVISVSASDEDDVKSAPTW